MSENSPTRVGNLAIQYLQGGTQFGGMGLFELRAPPGSNVPPPRSQTHNEECVYVLEGALRYSVDRVTRDRCAGDWMRTPKGSVSGRCLRAGGLEHSARPLRLLGAVVRLLQPPRQAAVGQSQ